MLTSNVRRIIALLCALLAIVLAVAGFNIFFAEKVRIYPPQEITVKHIAYSLMNRVAESADYYSDWPDREKYIEIVKKVRERFRPLEVTLGPLEIRDSESFDKANRVAIPVTTYTIEYQSDGKTKAVPGSDIQPFIIEKKDAEDGPHWYVVGDGNRLIEEMPIWLELPRRKAPGSPTIILKREGDSVVMQVIFKGKVVSEKTILKNGQDKVQGI